MFLEKYFDIAKQKLDLRSDAQLARHLGILPQDIVTAKRKGYLRDDVMLALCGIAEVPREELAAAREAEKAPEGSEMREVWAKTVELVKRGSAVLGIGAMFIGGLHSNDALANVARSTSEKNVRNITQVVDIPSNKDYRKYYRNLAARFNHFFFRFFRGFGSVAAI